MHQSSIGEIPWRTPSSKDLLDTKQMRIESVRPSMSQCTGNLIFKKIMHFGILLRRDSFPAICHKACLCEDLSEDEKERKQIIPHRGIKSPRGVHSFPISQKHRGKTHIKDKTKTFSSLAEKKFEGEIMNLNGISHGLLPNVPGMVHSKFWRGACWKCLAAGRGVRLSCCSKCKEAHYCSRDCQVAHWKSHKRVCVSIRAHPDPLLTYSSQLEQSRAG